MHFPPVNDKIMINFSITNPSQNILMDFHPFYLRNQAIFPFVTNNSPIHNPAHMAKGMLIIKCSEPLFLREQQILILTTSQ